MKLLIERAYQEFIRKLWKNPSFIYDPIKKDISCINTFISTLDKEYGLESLGESFIYNYFCFQINYWNNIDSRFGKKIPISWFIGKKAFDRWINNTEEDLYHAYETANLLKIDRSSINIIDTVQINSLQIKEIEEREKIRFSGIEKLQNCLETTTLFNHNSQYCTSCEFQEECKILLKENYYRLYLKRGYYEKNTIKTGKGIQK